MNKIKEIIEKAGKKEKIMFISGIACIMLGLILSIGSSLASPDTTILQNKEIEGLKIEEVSLEYDGEASIYTAKITNTNSSTYNLKYIELVFKNEDESINKLIGYIGKNIDSNETKEIKASIDKDITKAISLDYNIIK